MLFARACLETGRIEWLQEFNHQLGAGLSPSGWSHLQQIFLEANERLDGEVSLSMDLRNTNYTSGLGSEYMGPHRMNLSEQVDLMHGEEEDTLSLPTEPTEPDNLELDRLTHNTPHFNALSSENLSLQRIPTLCGENNQPIRTIFTQLPHQHQE